MEQLADSVPYFITPNLSRYCSSQKTEIPKLAAIIIVNSILDFQINYFHLVLKVILIIPDFILQIMNFTIVVVATVFVVGVATVADFTVAQREKNHFLNYFD